MSPSGPSWPESARRRVLARPRVRCCSSSVTRYDGHIVPASNLRQWPLLLHISTALEKPSPRVSGPVSHSLQSSAVRIGSSFLARLEAEERAIVLLRRPYDLARVQQPLRIEDPLDLLECARELGAVERLDP